MAQFVPSSELLELLNSMAEDELTPDNESRLAEILEGDDQARRYYLDFVSMLTSLRWEYGEAALTGQSKEKTGWSQSWQIFTITVAVAALILIAVNIWLGNIRKKSDSVEPVAVLFSSNNARWGASTLQTKHESKVGPGILRLETGMARIHFISGTIAIMEAPAELELRSKQNCILHEGRVMFEVPAPAVGFTVDTPTTIITDLGTEFGVYVAKSGLSEVSVLKGQVEVRHVDTGTIRLMQTGENLRFARDKIQDFNPDAYGLSSDDDKKNTNDLIVTITTEEGKGDDTYIESTVALRKRFRSSDLLLVKNSSEGAKNWTPRNRKVYLRFDLAKVNKTKLVGAELSLTAAPSGVGFSSQVPDATFVLYGLKSEVGDFWDDEITWENAPANRIDGKVVSGGATVPMSEVQRLGSFMVPQGVLQGRFAIQGDALVEFLKRDTNNLATIIVVRETVGKTRNGLVHAFASHRHRELPPPTLRLFVKADEDP